VRLRGHVDHLDRATLERRTVFGGHVLQGGPLREPKFAERYFKPAALAAGLPVALRVHDLRHTCASLLIREGATIKAVQRHLGHKSASITLDHYGHLFPGGARPPGRPPARPGWCCTQHLTLQHGIQHPIPAVIPLR
jgi:integrase